MKRKVPIHLSVGMLLAIAIPAIAQEMVHATTGTVSAVDPAHKTITLFQDGGSKSTFNVKTPGKTRISFDKEVEDKTTPANEFRKQGSYVILFYYGMDPNRTAVALKDLGQGPFSSTTGEVKSWDGHRNTLVVTGKDEKTHSFKVQPATVAETYAGAVDGSDFRVEKGDHVRIVSNSVKNGSPTALFIRMM
jgi:hypothetical protein